LTLRTAAWSRIFPRAVRLLLNEANCRDNESPSAAQQGSGPVKNIRLIMSSVVALAALTATSGFALPSPEASAQTLGAHSVNWGDVTIPGRLCEVKGQIKLHNGLATVSHSGHGIPLDVYTTIVTHGYLRHGLPVTALQIFCANTGGTAAGQIAEGIFVFASPGGQPHLLGTLTPRYYPSAPAHIPYIAVTRIDTTGHVTVTEYFYSSTDADCCPSGRAVTIWKWTGRTFIPGRTKIIAR
jgi:hypothetical protein